MRHVLYSQRSPLSHAAPDGYHTETAVVQTKSSDRLTPNRTHTTMSKVMGPANPAIAVTDGGKPVGVLTRQDIISYLSALA